MKWANFVSEKNEGILFSAEIRVACSYMDRLLTVDVQIFPTTTM